MRTIVLLTYHGTGHFNACFKIAKILQSEYNIVFAGFSLFKEYVEGQGFAYYSLETVPFGLRFEQWQNIIEGKKNIYFHSLKDRWTDRLYKLRETELSGLLEEVKPVYILIDSLQSTDFIVVYPYAKQHKVKIGFLQTTLPQVVRKDCPPINSLIFPDQAKEIRQAITRLYFTQFAKSFATNIKYFGKSDSLMVKRRMKLNQMGREYESKSVTPNNIPVFNHIDEFILTPCEFDFPQNDNSAFSRYVGFMVDEERVESHNKDLKEVQMRLKKSRESLIYCSFGTVKLERTDPVKAFLGKLINVVRNKQCFLIVSISAPPQSIIQDNLPDNVLFFETVPQLEVLSKASLFITCGGLNSIKEAIYAGVPMLVYPSNPRVDQNGNSSRVVFHQLGLRGDIRADSEKVIEEKIDELLGNSVYKEKITELKKIDHTYTAEKFRELLDHMNTLE